MLNEKLLNSKKPIKRKQLGSRSEIAKRMADSSKPLMIGLPGPNGGYIIRPTQQQIADHEIWCTNWKISMASTWYDNLLEEEFIENNDDILFEMFGVDSEEELDYALDCYWND